MDSFFNQQNLLFHQQLQVRRRLDGPSKLFCSSLIFFIVLFSAGIVSVLTAPRFIPRSCDKSRTVLDSPWGIVSDDTHPSTNGNYTQVSTLVNKQIIRSEVVVISDVLTPVVNFPKNLENEKVYSVSGHTKNADHWHFQVTIFSKIVDYFWNGLLLLFQFRRKYRSSRFTIKSF